MTVDLQALSAEFPREAVSWRAQTMTRDNTKALALAYIDARDVMERLDAVCGPANWQDRYEFHGARTVCYLSIRIGDEWITKADGAGDSDVEAEKGAISDALKRAAVKWGIGRYLYAIVSPWVPCETYEKGGKHYWSKWSDDPWNHVRGGRPAQQPHPVAAPPTPKPDEPKPRLPGNDAANKLKARITSDLKAAANESTARMAEVWKANMSDIKRLPETMELDLIDLKEALKAAALANA